MKSASLSLLSHHFQMPNQTHVTSERFVPVLSCQTEHWAILGFASTLTKHTTLLKTYTHNAPVGRRLTFPRTVFHSTIQKTWSHRNLQD